MNFKERDRRCNLVNLTQLTAYIGENIEDENQSEFSSLIKSVKPVKENEQAYVVALVFDFKMQAMYFKLLEPYRESRTNQYYYFGNNGRSSSQYYLTRETRSLNYLLTTIWNDLYLMLHKNGLSHGELGEIIKKLADSGFISLGTKKGEGKVNIDRFSLLKDTPQLSLDKTSIKFNEKSYSFEKFVRLFLNDENKKNRFVLVVPMVKLESGESFNLSSHPEYLELVKQANNLGENKLGKKGEERVCYICGQRKNDVSSEYSTDFKSSGINKIFTTTKKNTAPYLQNYDYDNVYSMCTACYQKLRAGEKNIANRFRGKIAEENVFIIPEGLMDNFDYNYMAKIKKDIDFAFKSTDAEEWLRDIEEGVEEDFTKSDLYSVNFVFYRTDGKSVSVLETIEDVPTLRFLQILKLFNYYKYELNNHLRSFSLDSLYHLIPVRIVTNGKEKGKQLDIGKVLSLYKALLSGEQISLEVLYGYATEALDKGLKQLAKDKVDNFINLGLTGYKGKEDFFIKRIIMSYLVLIKICQQLNLLNQNVFKVVRKEEEKMTEINTVSEKTNLSIQEMEKFLDKQDFSQEARALFYLGVLINRVVIAQSLKGHKNKPILKKIQFQGMKDKEIYRLYQDVVEKLHQYRELTIFSEAIMNRFHTYYGSLDKKWPLSEQANVFYLMAGYAYMVGTKAPDLTNEERTVQSEDLETVENEK